MTWHAMCDGVALISHFSCEDVLIIVATMKHTNSHFKDYYKPICRRHSGTVFQKWELHLVKPDLLVHLKKNILILLLEIGNMKTISTFLGLEKY